MKHRSCCICIGLLLLLIASLSAQPYTWDSIPHALTTEIKSVAVNPNGHIFIGMESADPALMYKTEDKGSNWTDVSWDYSDWFFPPSSVIPDVHEICISQTGQIYAAAQGNIDFDWMVEGGVFTSLDNGTTWDRLFYDPFGSHFNIALNSNDVIYVAPYEEVYYSTDGGNLWKCCALTCPPMSGYIGTGIGPIEVNSAGQIISTDFYLYSGSAYWRSFDHSILPLGLTCMGINSLGLYFGSDNAIYFNDGISATSDDAWVNIGPSGRYINNLFMTVSDDIYAATDDGIYKSDDNGTSWNQIGLAGMDVQEINMITPDRIVARTATNSVHLGTLTSPLAYMVITTPNGTGIEWEHLNEYYINWTVVGTVGDFVKLELMQGNTVIRTIVSNTENDNAFKWFVNRCIPPASDYRIKITSLSQPDKYYVAAPFSIIPNLTIPAPKTYTANSITPLQIPAMDGIPSEGIWGLVDEDTLRFGGTPPAYNTAWTDDTDNLTTWKAIWCPANDKLYVAVTVTDDIRGTFDNNPASANYSPSNDESLEFFTNGDCDCLNYWELYAPAQFWRVTEENHRNLYNWPTPGDHPYSGSDFITAVSMGSGGNWTCEAEFTLYNTYDTDLKTLTIGDSIGWDVWINDTDDETLDGYYKTDHQIGWNYQGPVWKQSDYQGYLKFGPPLAIPVNVDGSDRESLPDDFIAYSNYPNPFNPVTHIIYALPKAQHVNITVYDIRGHQVSVLVNEYQERGNYCTIFNGTDFSSGIYYYKITTDAFSYSGKMTLIK